MKDPLVSCIVPVYNVEKYLDKCIESIVNQTYKNIEIIVIDDGSTDSSPILCDRWKEKDPRIVVIHKENEGASSARNVGLDNMHGEWIVFIDSDDYIHPQYVELLLNAVKKHNVLMACCSLDNVFYNHDISEFCEYNNSSQKIYLNSTIDSFYMITKTMIVAAWNKIYHVSLFDKFRFFNGKIHEDYGLLFYLIGAIYEYALVPYPLYYYLYNSEGITRSVDTMKRMDIIDVTMQQYYYFYEHNQIEYTRLILKTCIDFFPGLYCNLMESKQLDKKVFFKKYKEVFRIMRKNKRIDRKIILKHRMFLWCPFLIHLLKRNRS